MKCDTLTKYFGNTQAIDNLSVTSFTSFLGILGPNGSGKSTLLKLLLGLIIPDDGSAELGVNREGIRVVPDYPSLPNHLTVSEWIDILELYYGNAPTNLDLEIEFKLNGTWKLSDLSVGQKRLASLMPIFFGTPQLIILDEPTNFLDIVLRDRVLNMIKARIASIGCRVIISSHRIDEIELLASEVIILNKGQFVSKLSLKLDTRLGYEVRVNKLDAFEQYLKNYKIKYQVNESLLGKVVHVKKLDKLLDAVNDYNRDGGFVFNISAVNSLQTKLGEFV